jgi:hypothetical protein
MLNDPTFSEEVAKSYAFTEYKLINSRFQKGLTKFDAFITFTRADGTSVSKAMDAALEVLVVKTDAGTWKPATWYFLP